MRLDELHLGAVFRTTWDDRPCRVIAFDDDVVMYDTLWVDSCTWSLARFNSNCSYLRLTTAMVLSEATYLRTEEYTIAEHQLHRPDLPLSLCAHSGIDWSGVPPSDTAATTRLLEALDDERTPAERMSLPLAAVYLQPIGSKKGQKRGVLVKATNGQAFTEPELIWSAWNIQAPFVGEQPLTRGVGLYRSGLTRKVPSYYIWGDKSLLERP